MNHHSTVHARNRRDVEPSRRTRCACSCGTSFWLEDDDLDDDVDDEDEPEDDDEDADEEEDEDVPETWQVSRERVSLRYGFLLDFRD